MQALLSEGMVIEEPRLAVCELALKVSRKLRYAGRMLKKISVIRFQWSGGVQGRHCTQTSLIQLFLSKIAWRIKDATEKPSRESFWIIMKRLPRSQISANSLFLWIDFKVSWRNGLLWRSSWKWTQLNNQCHSESRTTVSPFRKQWRQARLPYHVVPKLPRDWRWFSYQ